MNIIEVRINGKLVNRMNKAPEQAWAVAKEIEQELQGVRHTATNVTDRGTVLFFATRRSA